MELNGSFLHKHKRLLLLGVDFCLILAAFFLTCLSFASFPQSFWNGLIACVLLCALYAAIDLFTGAYRCIWRYAQAQQYALCAICVAGGAVLFGIFNLIFPVSGWIGFWPYLTLCAYTLAALVGARVTYRVLSARLLNLQNVRRRRALIVGAGEAAMSLIADARENPHCDFVPVAAVDDDPSKIGRRLSGIPVCGAIDEISRVAREYRVSYIIVAIPSIKNAKRAQILDICSELGIAVRMMPQVADLPDPKDPRRILNSLRDITADELLGREEVVLNDENLFSFLSGKRVLVTGVGSIGSELCRQIAKYAPAQLVLFDIYENNAYDIEQELRRKYGDKLDLVTLIGSVRDYARVKYVFETYKPQIVFHAAAHKHVPLMEDSPQEAIKNNVFGTLNAVRAAMAYRVQKFILISTDKAVNPTNVMGATKRICEMIVQSFAGRSETLFAAVRFGNVLGSNGSVIPLFKQQIREGGPVTVTDPEIIRYFMTIPEAAQLVLTAGALARGGEIFILDMGKPVKIADLARKIIQLSGLKEGEDIEIRYTGLRPGEKLYEELLMSEEGLRQTENAKIFIGRPITIDPAKFARDLTDLSRLVHEGEPTMDEVIALLERVVDTFRHAPDPSKAAETQEPVAKLVPPPEDEE